MVPTYPSLEESSHGINSLLLGEARAGNASRLMKSKDYVKIDCDENGSTRWNAASECNGVMPTKWEQVAFDVLAVITHPS